MPPKGLDMETVTGVSSWMVCSVGMMILNKQAISVFPDECTLTALQMVFSVLVLVVFGYKYIHIGSLFDFLRWCMVTPFFAGMLLTSMLALKNASMTLVIVFRCLSPVPSLVIERFYPNPIRISLAMCMSILMMVCGTCLYAMQLPPDSMEGIQWVLLNMFVAVGDRLLQRLMLAKDQSPVDISKTGVTLINNAVGAVVVGSIALGNGELRKGPQDLAQLSAGPMVIVVLSCIVSVGISYTGVWAQSLISATSFLMLVNANKFVIIFYEVLFMQSKVIDRVQLVGAVMAVTASVLYGRARQVLEAEQHSEDSAETKGIKNDEKTAGSKYV
ncbi:unnamed protein product [Effrenium voratum]|uniref:Sugar phosphate transporter domain-containing protein n=1 Tax=Effrenium voratum TaxID=2562239 RepID=A0AA36NDE2_9DINO|nr:unnamed protein product [Effrenium voratum]CAJ1398123.1 unnamed protein product [Effrenium voratum]|mmetsp:Transcript_8585/g.20399  ORF Transcript_8585/g.20399 Transcript_8585/m.20399 type:complete len:330 (+) Transcript_8585:94-1083(+)